MMMNVLRMVLMLCEAEEAGVVFSNAIAMMSPVPENN